jgi:hypothetical protein
MQLLSNPRGQSVIGALIGVGIAAATIIVVISLQEILARQQAQSNFTFQTDELRRLFQSTLNNQAGWAQTYTRAENSPPYSSGPDFTAPPATNAGLNCFIGAGSDCTDAGGNPITNAPINVIRDSNGAVIYNILTNNGFTMQGTPCNTFVAPPGNGTDQCPLRVAINWTAVCAPGPCTGANAVPLISIVPVYNPTKSSLNRVNFNPGNYAALFKRGSDGTYCWAYINGALVDTCPGNVGIGTPTPADQLAIVTDRVHNGGAHIGLTRSDTPFQTLITWSTTSAATQQFSIGQQAGDANLLRFDSNAGGNFAFVSGNVGIGTMTPASTFQVSGGYMQIPTTTVTPPASDCSQSQHVGRMVVSTYPNLGLLWVCQWGSDNIVQWSSRAFCGSISGVGCPP